MKQTEQALIGALIKYQQVDVVQHMIKPNHFGSKPCREIYEVMLEEYDMTGGVDVAGIGYQLSGRPWFEANGGVRYLRDCVDQAPPRGRTKRICRLVVNESINRDLSSLGDMARKSVEFGEEPEKVIEAIQDKIRQIGRETPGDNLNTVSDYLDEATEQIEKRMMGEDVALPTGIKGFDDLYGGLDPGDMMVIAAYRSVGKTALMNHILRHVSHNENEPVMAFSVEVVGTQYAINIARSTVGVDFSMRGGKKKKGRKTITPEEYEKWKEAVEKIETADERAPFLVVDDSSIPISEVCNLAKVAMHKHGIKVVAVDYAQIVSTEGEYNSESLRLAHISHSLKRLANNTGLRVIVLSQRTEREGRRRTHWCPQLEQDADCMLYLEYTNQKFRDQQEMEPPEAGRTLAITKYRNKGTGVCFSVFNKPTLQFKHTPEPVVTPMPDGDVPEEQGQITFDG